MTDHTTPSEKPDNFIRRIIDADIAAGKNQGRVKTRFPPEPNGYLHIGHAKSICLNFGIARDYAGICHLRFDDTNPSREDVEYVEAIQEDVKWLGFDWGEHLYYASDYFPRLYECAVELIRKGKAYVCELTPEEMKQYRGAPFMPGKDSPYRNRSVEENLALFERMKGGAMEEGSCVLRAKIDPSSPNAHLRDPAIFRIKRDAHHRTGTQWCIYPMYDFAHCVSDSLEGITHSICTLEFEVHRPLYDWFLDELGIHHPQQIEFARLNLTYTVMSKRKLQELVVGGHVAGWDDPRMPTIAGMRRRGYTPAAIRAFCDRVGVTKFNSLTDVALLEHCVRDDLNRTSRRGMAVLNPLRLVIDNYPADREEFVEAGNNPEDPAAGTRRVPFARELYIEQDDFREVPPKGYFRLSPGQEVRLRCAYYVRCTSVVKDPATGAVTEVHGTYDPASAGGGTADGRKVKGTIHWVSARHARQAEVRLYDRLFTVEDPAGEAEGGDFKAHMNPDSLKTVTAWVEPSLADAAAGERYQFERLGYFCADARESKPGAPVFNRTVTLRDAWAKLESRQARPRGKGGVQAGVT